MKKLILLLMVLAAVAWTVPAGYAGTPRESQHLIGIFDRADSKIREEGNYPEALDLFLEFIRGAEGKSGMESRLLQAYLSVAVIYGSFGDTDHAIAYNKLAYPLARRLSDEKSTELALTNLAQSYREKKDYVNASRTADSLLTLDSRNSPTLIFHHSIIKGELALQLGMNEEARAYFLKADSAARAENLTAYEKSAPLEMLAAYFKTTCRPDSQLVYLNRAWQLVSSQRDPQPKAECALLLMKFHTEHGNIDLAKAFQQQYLSLTDSLVNLQQFLSVSARHEQSRMDSKGVEIAALNREAFYHKIIIAVIATFLLLAIGAIIIIIRQKRNLDAAYKALFEKNRRLMNIRPDEETKEETADSADHTSGTPGSREEERNRALFDRIKKAMEETDDYLSPDFGLSNLVSVVGSNVAYVSKVVKIYAGQNVPSFINEYRIREACRRLVDEDKFGNITCSAIGESVGFSSQVSFNRAFKKVTGLTPSLYQKMAFEEHRGG